MPISSTRWAIPILTSNGDRRPARLAAIGFGRDRRSRHTGGLSRAGRKPDGRDCGFSFDCLVERYGDDAALREALLGRVDLPATTRHTLMVKLSATLVGFVVERQWLGEERAQRAAREAREKATIVLAAGSTSAATVAPLVRHLRESAQLTAGLMLRALLSGNVAMFEQALAELSGLPLSRVIGIVHDRRGAGFRALYDKAGL